MTTTSTATEPLTVDAWDAIREDILAAIAAARIDVTVGLSLASAHGFRIICVRLIGRGCSQRATADAIVSALHPRYLAYVRPIDTLHGVMHEVVIDAPFPPVPAP